MGNARRNPAHVAASLVPGSLAVRLALLFVVSTTLVFLVLGASLRHSLHIELTQRDVEDLRGKVNLVAHHFLDVVTVDDLVRDIPRFADVAVGHDRVEIGLVRAQQWLLAPTESVRRVVEAVGVERLGKQEVLELAGPRGRRWWLLAVPHGLAGGGAPVHAVLAIDVTDATNVEERFRATLWLSGLAGILLVAALAWWAARQGLAPLGRIAAEAERVTAQRLGHALSIEDAPAEVRGLVASVNRMLERLDESFRSLEQFSADIAHELRTPVNGLLLQAQVTLSRERSAEEYRETLHESLEELEHLQRMVSDMLFIARADRDMTRITREPVPLRREIDALAEYFEPLAAERGQAIRITGEATVHGDRAMLRRAITNLLSNAVRYASADTTIKVTIENRFDAIVLTVANRCAAIADAELERLFDRFVRRGDVSLGLVEGTGLGLAIVRSIMKLHGGTAAARSLDGGVAFALEWPEDVAGEKITEM